MSISPHVSGLNDTFTRIERAAEEAPEGTFEQTKRVAEAVGDASKAVMAALRDHDLVALNGDKLREVEAMIFGYLVAGNPLVADELAAAEGFAEALDGPAAQRVRDQLVRDRDALTAARGARQWVEGHRDDVEAITEWAPLSEAPYRASNGLIVETASKLEDLLEIGDAMKNILGFPSCAAYYAHRIFEGREQIFRVRKGDEVLACGQLEVKRFSMRLIGIRGMRDRAPPGETIVAIDNYITAVNDGAVEIGWEFGEDGFVERRPDASPRP